MSGRGLLIRQSELAQYMHTCESRHGRKLVRRDLDVGAVNEELLTNKQVKQTLGMLISPNLLRANGRHYEGIDIDF
jgi:hypothetical protein